MQDTGVNDQYARVFRLIAASPSAALTTTVILHLLYYSLFIARNGLCFYSLLYPLHLARYLKYSSGQFIFV